eukprot:Tbor_TRINITY_DN4377_c0_g1::TRINITY_DN4377_c0_g1_i1::g.7843::m.7843
MFSLCNSKNNTINYDSRRMAIINERRHQHATLLGRRINSRPNSYHNTPMLDRGETKGINDSAAFTPSKHLAHSFSQQEIEEVNKNNSSERRDSHGSSRRLSNPNEDLNAKYPINIHQPASVSATNTRKETPLLMKDSLSFDCPLFSLNTSLTDLSDYYEPQDELEKCHVIVSSPGVLHNVRQVNSRAAKVAFAAENDGMGNIPLTCTSMKSEMATRCVENTPKTNKYCNTFILPVVTVLMTIGVIILYMFSFLKESRVPVLMLEGNTDVTTQELLSNLTTVEEMMLQHTHTVQLDVQHFSPSCQVVDYNKTIPSIMVMPKITDNNTITISSMYNSTFKSHVGQKSHVGYKQKDVGTPSRLSSATEQITIVPGIVVLFTLMIKKFIISSSFLFEAILYMGLGAELAIVLTVIVSQDETVEEDEGEAAIVGSKGTEVDVGSNTYMENNYMSVYDGYRSMQEEREHHSLHVADIRRGNMVSTPMRQVSVGERNTKDEEFHNFKKLIGEMKDAVKELQRELEGEDYIIENSPNISESCDTLVRSHLPLQPPVWGLCKKSQETGHLGVRRVGISSNV